MKSTRGDLLIKTSKTLTSDQQVGVRIPPGTLALITLRKSYLRAVAVLAWGSETPDSASFCPQFRRWRKHRSRRHPGKECQPDRYERNGNVRRNSLLRLHRRRVEAA